MSEPTNKVSTKNGGRGEKFFNQQIRIWTFMSNKSVAAGTWNNGVMESESDGGVNNLGDIPFNPASIKITISQTDQPRSFNIVPTCNPFTARPGINIFSNSHLKFKTHGLSKSDFVSISKHFLIPPSLPDLTFEIPPPPFVPSPIKKPLCNSLTQAQVLETFVKKSIELQEVSKVKAAEITTKVIQADYFDYKRGFREGMKLQKLRFARLKAREQESKSMPMVNGSTLISNTFAHISPRQGASPYPRFVPRKFSTVRPTQAEPQFKIKRRTVERKKKRSCGVRKNLKGRHSKVVSDQTRRMLRVRRQNKQVVSVVEEVEPYSPTRPEMFPIVPYRPIHSPIFLDLFDVNLPTPPLLKNLLNDQAPLSPLLIDLIDNSPITSLYPYITSPVRFDLSLTPQRNEDDVMSGVLTSYFQPL